MDEQFFAQSFDKLYAIFGKPMPRAAVVNAAYEMVADKPNGLMSFALEKLRTQSSLPVNVGNEIASMWSEFVTLHPEYRRQAAQDQQTFCGKCIGGGITAVKGGIQQEFRCPCNRSTSKTWANVLVWNDRLLSQGWQVREDLHPRLAGGHVTHGMRPAKAEIEDVVGW